MSITIQPPQPGDLITASFMKQLIDQLSALDQRLSALEGVVPGAGGTLAILLIEPNDVAVGDEIRIHGVNFGVPSENSVTFDSAFPTNTFKAGSNDNLLILDVPLIPLSGDSKVVTVAASSVRGQDSRQITIRSPVATIPSGTIGVGLQSAPSGAINAGNSYVFAFSLDVSSTLDETFTLTPAVPQAPTGEKPWQVAMVTDATGTTPLPVLAGAPTPPPWWIKIPKPALGQTSTVVTAFVQVTIPGQTSVANPFVKLNVASVNNPNGFSGGASPTITFTLGSAVPANQTIKFGALTSTGGSITGNSASFSVPTPNKARINYSIPGLAVGTYQLSLFFSGNSNGWGAGFDVNASTQLKQFQMTAAGDHNLEQIFISATNVSGSATLNLVVMTPAPSTLHQPSDQELAAATAYGVLQLTLNRA